jgi:hypothetical protein
MNSEELNTFKSELKADLAGLRVEMKADKYDVIKWVVGIGFAQIATILTIIKLH